MLLLRCIERLSRNPGDRREKDKAERGHSPLPCSVGAMVGSRGSQLGTRAGEGISLDPGRLWKVSVEIAWSRKRLEIVVVVQVLADWNGGAGLLIGFLPPLTGQRRSTNAS